MTVAIKICGLTTMDALDATIALKCDYAGMVFYPPSPRHVSFEKAAQLQQRARGAIATVAVTVDANDALIAAIMQQVQPELLQLHGAEPPERFAELKTRYPGLQLIKAVKVQESDDIAYALRFIHTADMLLFDAKPPKHLAGALPGGNGLAFDWNLLKGRNFPLPWFLSGGLNAENAGDALRLSGATMVDVSSSVEREPGVKDVRLMEQFVAAVRSGG